MKLIAFHQPVKKLVHRERGRRAYLPLSSKFWNIETFKLDRCEYVVFIYILSMRKINIGAVHICSTFSKVVHDVLWPLFLQTSFWQRFVYIALWRSEWHCMYTARTCVKDDLTLRSVDGDVHDSGLTSILT